MPETKTWRCSERALFWARLAFPTLCTTGAAFIVAGLAGATKLDVGLGFGVMLLLFGAAVQRCALYPSLEATPTRLIVRNPLSTKAVPWDRMKTISPGYSGLQIEVHGEPPITVWCVQKNNLDMARGNRTRADDVIDELAAYGADQTRRPHTEFIESAKEQSETTRSARVSILIGSFGLAIYIVLQIVRDSS